MLGVWINCVWMYLCIGAPGEWCMNSLVYLCSGLVVHGRICALVYGLVVY